MSNASNLRVLPVAVAVVAGGACLLRGPAVADQPSAPETPEYRVARATENLNLDGKPSDPLWEKAAVTAPFRITGDGAAAPLATEVRMLWDDDSLYVLFRCQDPEPWATLEEWDAKLYEEEVVEVFLQPDPAKAEYAEFEVNPLGTVMDTWCPNPGGAVPFDSWNLEGLRAAVAKSGKKDKGPGWTCEIGIPWKGLNGKGEAAGAPPKPGDRWRIGLYRIEAKPQPLLLSWSPTMELNFHVPAKFGTVVFEK